MFISSKTVRVHAGTKPKIVLTLKMYRESDTVNAFEMH